MNCEDHLLAVDQLDGNGFTYVMVQSLLFMPGTFEGILADLERAFAHRRVVVYRLSTVRHTCR